MSVVIKGLPADHPLVGCMGVYRQRVQGNNLQPVFVGGRCSNMVLYSNEGGWFVTKNTNQDDLLLWSARTVALPYLTKSSWVVFDDTKVPAPSFRIKKFKNCETTLEVKGGKGSLVGRMVAGKYTKGTRVHNGKPTYTCSPPLLHLHPHNQSPTTQSKAIWFEEGFGWCIGDEASIGMLRICMFHASDFAPTPDAVQSIWTRKADPVADPRVQVVIASAEPSPSSAQQEAFVPTPASIDTLPMNIAVIGVGEAYSGLYEKQEAMSNIEDRVTYVSADKNRVIWYNGVHWCVGPLGKSAKAGCFVFVCDSAISPLDINAAWHALIREPCSSVRVTKSKKKHTKVIEIKGVPTDNESLAQLNGKYRPQAQIVDGRPTFKGADGMHAIWYSTSDGSWRVGSTYFVGTTQYALSAKDNASTPNTVKATWHLMSFGMHCKQPCAKIILPSVAEAEQEVPRQMQLKVPELMAAEQRRCLNCGYQYTSQEEVLFHEECMHHHCACCSQEMGDNICVVCMEEGR
jgi:hypothetical protein